MWLVPRRRGLVLKLLLAVPVTWLLVTLLFTYTDVRLRPGADQPGFQQQEQQHPQQAHKDGDHLDSNAIKDSKPADRRVDEQLPPLARKRAERERPPSKEDDKEAKGPAMQAVLVPPRNPDGPGELGRPVVLSGLTEEQEKRVKKGWDQNAFNQYISDMISLHRSLPDVRDSECKEEKYLKKLPPTSVIVCFHNEAWSVLLRTVHSILDRSPDPLLREIILVDDFSDMPHLKSQLEDYVAHLPKVKIVRAQKREGLIRARLLGAAAATAPVLTYLDSHCECTEGWLEPLLDRIARNSTTVVCPVIDVISDSTFEYHYRDSGGVNVGGFDWNLQFSWHAVPERERKRRLHSWDPVWSPTMAGGLFSIDKAFFEKLGTYDSGFDIWGGENLELSFKTWMCGGTLEIVPCSHVGHIFRKRSPYKWRSGVNVLRRNSVRLAEVWLDEYAKYYYQRIGQDLGDFGDVSPRKALRKQLKCRSFDWYVRTIYPELFVPGDAVASGEVRNKGEGGHTCLDSPASRDNMHKAVGMYPCHGQGGNQYWMLSKEGEIRRDEACLDYAGDEVILYPCHGSKGNQLWLYDDVSHTIQHGSSHKCLEMKQDREKVSMETCNGNLRQHWIFQNYNATKAADQGKGL
ncbi:putative polypeptide N-acetylgalactosaminyltransferase 9 [Ixodes scapularis]